MHTQQELMECLEKAIKMLKSMHEDTISTKENVYDENRWAISLAKAYPIKNHVLVTESDEVRKCYISTLLYLSNNGTNFEIAKSQLLYVYRIIASYDSNVEVTEYMTKSLEIDKSYLSDIPNKLEKTTLIYFAVDLLVLNMLADSKKECAIYEITADILQMLKINSSVIEKAAHLAKSIIKQDFNLLIEQVDSSSGIDYSSLLGYFPDNIYTNIVGCLDVSTQKFRGKILIANVNITDAKDYINLDEYSAEELYFYNCHFDRIRGIRGNKKRIIFDHCKFENNDFYSGERSGYFQLYDNAEKNYTFIQGNKMVFHNTYFENIRTSKSLLDITDVEIENCSFLNCEGMQYPCSYMFQICRGKIIDCIFERCIMNTDRTSRNTTEGGIVQILNGILKNNKFEKCYVRGYTSYGTYASYKMQIVRAKGTKIYDCSFCGCSASQDDSGKETVENYIISMQNSNQHNIQFTECSAYHYQYGKRLSSYNIGEIG